MKLYLSSSFQARNHEIADSFSYLHKNVNELSAHHYFESHLVAIGRINNPELANHFGRSLKGLSEYNPLTIRFEGMK